MQSKRRTRAKPTNPARPRAAATALVSLGGTVKEHLPLPYTHYPPHYGTFLAFSETLSSPAFLCDCALPAIANHLALEQQSSRNPVRSTNALGLLDHPLLPSAVAALFQSADMPDVANLRFRRAICHRCNLTPPSLRYCHEMYGVVFIQHFGWYVNQTYLRSGIFPGAAAYLKENTPPEYIVDLEAIEAARSELEQAWQWFRDGDEALIQRLLHPDGPVAEVEFDPKEIARHQDILREATKKARRAERVLSTKIENTVRQEFGFRKVGERWTSETLLYQIVSNLLRDRLILRHHRPDWMSGLELDIYVPSLNLAIEYQGQQHFHSISAWGGEDALRKLQARDQKKVALCKALQVRLVTIDYTEPLTHDFVRERLSIEVSAPAQAEASQALGR